MFRRILGQKKNNFIPTAVLYNLSYLCVTFCIFSDYISSASVVFPNSDMPQYHTFSRIFLGKMLPANIPLSWLSMSEAGQGWMKGRFTKSLKLFVALMSDGFQRTSSFCSPINLSTSGVFCKIISITLICGFPSIATGGTPRAWTACCKSLVLWHCGLSWPLYSEELLAVHSKGLPYRWDMRNADLFFCVCLCFVLFHFIQ